MSRVSARWDEQGHYPGRDCGNALPAERHWIKNQPKRQINADNKEGERMGCRNPYSGRSGAPAQQNRKWRITGNAVRPSKWAASSFGTPGHRPFPRRASCGQRGQRKIPTWTLVRNSAYTCDSGWLEKASLAYWRNPEGLPSEFCFRKRTGRIRRRGNHCWRS